MVNVEKTGQQNTPYFLQLIHFEKVGDFGNFKRTNHLGYYCDRPHLLQCYNAIGHALGLCPATEDHVDTINQLEAAEERVRELEEGIRKLLEASP